MEKNKTNSLTNNKSEVMTISKTSSSKMKSSQLMKLFEDE